MLAELQSHYLFADRFGRPGKGNDKGKGGGLVGYVRRNFMTPLPVAESFDAFDARFLDACMKRRQRCERGATLVTSNLPFDEWTWCSVRNGSRARFSTASPIMFISWR